MDRLHLIEIEMDKKQLLSKMNEQMSFNDLFRQIPPGIPEGFAAALLCIIGLTPLLPLLFPLEGELVIPQHLNVYFALKSVGYMGLVYGGFMFFYKRSNYKTGKKTLRDNLRQNGLKIFLALMLIQSVLATVFSTNPALSFFGDAYRKDGLISYFAYAGIFILAANVKKEKNIRLIAEVMCFSASVLALLCFIDNPEMMRYFHMNYNRAIFFNPNHFGYFVAMALTASIMFVVKKPEPRTNIRYWAGLYFRLLQTALLSGALMLCGSLGPLLAVCGALVTVTVLSFFIDRSSFKRFVLVVLLIAVVAGFSSVGVWDLAKESRIFGFEIDMVFDKLSGEDVDISKIGRNRGMLYAGALEFISERPLFGYGPDNLGAVYREYGTVYDRPHNELLQFAASLGVPAALFYICAMSAHLAKFVRKFKKINLTALCLYGAVLAYLISSMFGNTMYYTSPFFFMLLGLSDSAAENAESGSSENAADIAAENRNIAV